MKATSLGERIRNAVISFALVAALTSSVSAAIVVDPGSPYDYQLQSITIDGTEHTYDSLIGVELTEFNMSNSSGTGQINIYTSSAPSTGAAAVAALEDAGLTTGYARLNSVGFDFSTPVVNGEGPDVFIFRMGTSGSVLNVTINGQTNDVLGDFVVVQAVASYKFFRDSTIATNISILESLDFEGSTSTSTGAISYAAIDLSDYAVAPGASVSGISMTGDGTGPSITGVYGIVPEPATMGLLAAVCPLLLRRRRG